MRLAARAFRFCEFKVASKRYHSKPYGIFRDDVALFVSPFTAQIEERINYISVASQGSFCFKLVPIRKENGKMHLEIAKNIVFMVSINNIVPFIGLTDEEIMTKTFAIRCEYFNRNKWMTIKKQSQDSEMITIQSSVLKQPGEATGMHVDYDVPSDLRDTLRINVSKSELIVVRELCRFSLPYLMGWHFLNPVSKVDSFGDA